MYAKALLLGSHQTNSDWGFWHGCFVCFDSLCPSQQFFSHVGTGLPGFCLLVLILYISVNNLTGLPGLNQ